MNTTQSNQNNIASTEYYNGCLIKNKFTSEIGIILDCDYMATQAAIVKVMFSKQSGHTKVEFISKNVIETIC